MKVFLFTLLLVFSLKADVLLADSTSQQTITLREKYGPELIVDNVTVIIEYNGAFYITRNKKFWGIFPVENYSIFINTRKNK